MTDYIDVSECTPGPFAAHIDTISEAWVLINPNKEKAAVIFSDNAHNVSLYQEAHNVTHETGMTPKQMAEVVRLARVYREASRRWNDAMDSRNSDGCDNAHAELELARTALFDALDQLDGDRP